MIEYMRSPDLPVHAFFHFFFSLLQQQGFELVPLVISVGDYVLTPEICVERKSLADLFQSMNSGRLFNQVRGWWG